MPSYSHAHPFLQGASLGVNSSQKQMGSTTCCLSLLVSSPTAPYGPGVRHREEGRVPAHRAPLTRVLWFHCTLVLSGNLRLECDSSAGGRPEALSC